MKEYIFFFNDKGEFVCRVTTSRETQEFVNFKAVSKLRGVDRINFSNAKATSRSIQLSNERIKVYISDIDDFFQSGYADYIPNSIEKVNKAIVKYQRKKLIHNNVQKAQSIAVKGMAGALVMMLLSSAAKGLSKKSEPDKEDTQTQTQTVEEVVDENKQKIDIVGLGLSTSDIDELLSELEEIEDLKTEPGMPIEKDEEKPENGEYINLANGQTVFLDYEDMTNSITFTGAYEKYYDTVEKYATKWGISPNLVMAILTQESAGKETNLMQVQFNSWLDQIITNYDFVNGKYQSIVLTNTPEKYAGKGITVITKDDMKNKVTNISVGCIILRYCLEQMNYNIPAAIQAYNLGTSNMRSVLQATSDATGLSISELLADPTNLEFTNYTGIVNCGDPQYLMNVSRYLENEGNVSIAVLEEDGNVSYVEITLQSRSL